MSEEHFIIRPAGVDDAEAILAIYAPYIRRTAVTFEITVPTPEDFRKRVRQISAAYPYLLAEKDGELLGYCYANRFREREAFCKAVEMSLYVRDDLRGRGIGGRLYRALEEELKKMDIQNCYACIASPRGEDPYLGTDSPQFHEHIGYRTVGKLSRCGYKFGRWYDMLIMEKFIGEHEMEG